jgi:hypothetical protein
MVALAVSCPFADDNPPECPLHSVRTWTTDEILDWIDGLSADDLRFLFQYHDCCLAVKLETQLFGKPGPNPASRGASALPH